MFESSQVGAWAYCIMRGEIELQGNSPAPVLKRHKRLWMILPAIGGSLFFFPAYPFIFLDDNKPASAILAGPQIPFFFLVSNSAKDIKIDLKTVTFTTMRTKFIWHFSALFF